MTSLEYALLGALMSVVFISAASFAGGDLRYTFETLAECRAAMDELRTNADLRGALGERGRTKALLDWTPDAHLTRYLEIIEELLPASASASAS